MGWKPRATHLQEVTKWGVGWGVAGLSSRHCLVGGWLWGPSQGKPLVTLMLAGWRAQDGAGAGAPGVAGREGTGWSDDDCCVCEVRTRQCQVSALQHVDPRGRCGPGLNGASPGPQRKLENQDLPPRGSPGGSKRCKHPADPRRTEKRPSVRALGSLMCPSPDGWPRVPLSLGACTMATARCWPPSCRLQRSAPLQGGGHRCQLCYHW